MLSLHLKSELHERSIAGSPAKTGALERPALESLVLATVRRLMGADIAADAPLLQAGLDSLAAMELSNELNRCA